MIRIWRPWSERAPKKSRTARNRFERSFRKRVGRRRERGRHVPYTAYPRIWFGVTRLLTQPPAADSLHRGAPFEESSPRCIDDYRLPYGKRSKLYVLTVPDRSL